MIVAVPRETFSGGERRVALIPATIPALTKAGMKVIVEAGAGQAAGYADQLYIDKGATIVAQRAELLAQADIVLQVRVDQPAQAQYRAGQAVIGMSDPLGSPAIQKQLADKGITLLALELIPRITRAQSMDVLSSMASLAGYRAVLLGATTLPRILPMMMTAAGTIPAAKVLIVGAGVAGLQAIATARRLGAVVSAYDVRPAAKEQVKSLGAKFVEMPLDTQQSETKGGYAQALGEEFYRKQQALMSQVVGESDIVITTAAVPGKKAPVLVNADMVAKMAAGAVIVDLAAERGGNCELTRPGETFVTPNGVTILGPTNLPSEIPYHASQMYSKNISTFLLNMTKAGQLNLDVSDEIVRETLVARGGEVVHAKVKELLQPPAPTEPAK